MRHLSNLNFYYDAKKRRKTNVREEVLEKILVNVVGKRTNKSFQCWYRYQWANRTIVMKNK